MIWPSIVLGATILGEAVKSSALPVHSIFENPAQVPLAGNGYRIPTIRESAVMARRILHLESMGTTSTIFSTDDDTVDDSVAGQPIGIMEYFADCEGDTGNPTFLAVTMATTFRNAALGSNVTLSLRWNPPGNKLSPAALPRFALIGHIEDMTAREVQDSAIKQCYKGYHPDVFWYPGNDIHVSKWVRLVVDKVYWFGGFGDRSYIGWIPVQTWRNVTMDEIESCRLPGEEKQRGMSFSWW